MAQLADQLIALSVESLVTIRTENTDPYLNPFFVLSELCDCHTVKEWFFINNLFIVVSFDLKSSDQLVAPITKCKK